MAAGSTYTPIATTTLGSAAPSYTFTSIPSTYTDLVLIATGYNATSDGSAPLIQFNSDTGTNYSDTELYGDGTSAGSNRRSNNTYITLYRPGGWDTSSTQPGMFTVNIMNYSNTTTYKTALVRSNIASASYPSVETVAGLWRSTSAINSVTIGSGGTLAAGCTFTLYGIQAA